MSSDGFIGWLCVLMFVLGLGVFFYFASYAGFGLMAVGSALAITAATGLLVSVLAYLIED